MSYRDDRDADQARIAALEAELAQAQRRIDELENPPVTTTALVPNAGAVRDLAQRDKGPWYGAPMRFNLARTFDGEYPPSDFEELLEIIRKLSPERGTAEILKSSMTWTVGANRKDLGPQIEVTVTVRDGKTELTLTDNVAKLAGVAYGAIGGGVGGGGIMLPLLPIFGMPLLLPLTLSVWLGGWFLATRAIFKRGAKKRASKLLVMYLAVAVAIEKKLGQR